MCGIIGYFTSEKINLNKKNILSSLEHRGPDNSSWIEYNQKPYFFLGFTRLAIIDLHKRSNQPYKYKNLIICFNGEIYNFLEIKKDLISKGIKFETKGDCEVLIKLIYHEGIKSINRLEGMWSFVLYDEKKKVLILSRDRFGEKPLFYYHKNNQFFFSSELQSFKFLIYDKLKVNKNFLKKYIFTNYRYHNKTNETFFKDIKKINPGTILKINKKFQITKSNYYNLNFKTKEISHKNLILKTRQILINAIKKSLNSDVPVAFCLSGGVDSTGLVSIAKKRLKKDLNCFTINTQDKLYDEYKSVSETVKKLKIKHHWIKINKNTSLDNLKKIIAKRLSPFSTITNYIQWFLYKKIAQKGFKVAISGNGSDEIFSGYYDHHLAYLHDINKNKKLYNISIKNWKKNVIPHIRNKQLKDPLYFSKSKKPKYLFDNFTEINKIAKQKVKFNFSEKNFSTSILRNRMLNELFHESLPVILYEEDLNAMNFSVENRSPYLNYELFRFMQTVPIKHFIKNGYAKNILRQTLGKISPKHVIKRHEKIGFNISLQKLINFRTRKVINFIKKNSQIYTLVKKSEILKIIDSNNLINKNEMLLFKCLNAKILLEKHNF